MVVVARTEVGGGTDRFSPIFGRDRPDGIDSWIPTSCSDTSCWNSNRSACGRSCRHGGCKIVWKHKSKANVWKRNKRKKENSSLATEKNCQSPHHPPTSLQKLTINNKHAPSIFSVVIKGTEFLDTHLYWKGDATFICLLLAQSLKWLLHTQMTHPTFSLSNRRLELPLVVLYNCPELQNNRHIMPIWRCDST